MLIQDITLDEFVAHYALRIFSRKTLQLGLLLARGMPLEQAERMTHSGDKKNLQYALAELQKLGYIKPSEVEVN